MHVNSKVKKKRGRVQRGDYRGQKRRKSRDGDGNFRPAVPFDGLDGAVRHHLGRSRGRIGQAQQQDGKFEEIPFG